MAGKPASKLGHLLEQVEEGNTDVSESLPRALLKTGIPRLDLLPGQKKLRRYFLPETGREERHDLVSSLISAIQQSSTPAGQRAGTYAYDWVILDTPPALEAPTTVLTTSSNALVSVVHHRMPVILSPDAEKLWLQGSPDEARQLLLPYPVNSMENVRVSRRVNSPANDSPDILLAC